MILKCYSEWKPHRVGWKFTMGIEPTTSGMLALRHSIGMNRRTTHLKFVCPRMSQLRTLLAFPQPVNCIFWPIETLNWLVATSKLHKHRGTCCIAEWPCCPFAILCLRSTDWPTWSERLVIRNFNQPGVVFTQSSTLISYTPEYNNTFTSWYNTCIALLSGPIAYSLFCGPERNMLWKRSLMLIPFIGIGASH